MRWILYIFAFVILSCSGKENIKQKYKNQFELYLSEQFSTNLKKIDNSNIVLIDLSCIDCIGGISYK